MDKGYKLPRWGDNVAALLKKIEDFQENFILMKGCGDRWKDGLAEHGKECFFNFTYDELAEPVINEKVVFLLWEDQLDWLPPKIASCSYMNFGQTGVMVKIDKIQSTRVLLLTRGTNGEIVVSADEEVSGTPDETDPIFTQWLQSHELYTKNEVDDLLAPLEAVIPSSASSSNKLADKDYVDNSIATSTAIFVGTFNSLSELQAVQNPTNNDYGFVIEHDAQGNEYYKRYKYNGTQWLFEYKIESTPFTAAQWAAIQSGITSALVTKLNKLPTNAELQQTLDGKANAANTYTKDEVDEIVESIGSPITEIQRSALDNTTTPGMYKVVGTTGSSAANSSWISLLLVSKYDFSKFGGSTDRIVTQRLFNGRGASVSVKLEERTKVNDGAWSEWGDIYGNDFGEIWTELNAKQDSLTFDNAPTANSTNPVQSGGVYDAIEGGFYY